MPDLNIFSRIGVTASKHIGARPLDKPICLFCYHKVGTVLLSKVFGGLCKHFGWTFTPLLGHQTGLPADSNVVLYKHSLIDPDTIDSPYVGIHVIRDPRDIIVSGYLYHLRTDEQWCVNKEFESKKPIRFPQVPYSQEHRSEEWKREYLRSLGGKSYQEHLQGMSQSDGLLFEMEHYGAWTVRSMLEWPKTNEQVLDVQFENLSIDFDATFSKIFDHCGFGRTVRKTALRIAQAHDIGRKSEKELARMKHVSSRSVTKWREYFEERHERRFKELFGDAVERLGYEPF
jgi:sulfotransferase family protein